MVKRVNYFDGQFLHAKDFTDEQSYHIAMRRSHNSLLHTYGVADGLIPSKIEDTARIEVSEGFAIDAQGREIQLDHAVRSEDLAGFRGTSPFITIAWQEIDADSSSEAGGVTRKEQKPVIGFSTDAPKDGERLIGGKLILGTVTVGADGKVASVDASTPLRSMAGAKGGNLSAVGLSLTGLNFAPEFQPQLSVATQGQIDLKGSLKIDGGLTVGKNTTLAGDLAVTGRVFIGNNGQLLDDGNFHIHANAGQMWLNALDDSPIQINTQRAGNVLLAKAGDAGRVGVGTVGPTGKLNVVGSAGEGKGIQLDNQEIKFRGDGVAHFSLFANRVASAFTIDNTSKQTGMGEAQVSANLMTIRANGNVGIGTTTPAQQLHVHKADDSGWSGMGLFSGQSQTAVIGTHKGKPVVGAHVLALNAWSTLYVNNDGDRSGATTIMGIGGNVGIGTPAPSAQLHLHNATRGGDIGIGQQNESTPYLRLGMDTGYKQFLANNAYWTGTEYKYVNTKGYSGTASAIRQISGRISLDTASGGVDPITWAERLVVTNSGDVGIGREPQYKLDVNGTVRIGGFTTGEGDEWANVVWCRETGSNWDEGLIKHSAGHAKFGRAGFGIHMHETREFVFFSTNWTPLVSIQGGTGHVRAKGTFQANQGDLSEIYFSDAELAPGELVSLDPDADRIIRSREADAMAVIGIVSTAPGVLLNVQDASSEASLPAGVKGYPVALCGRVPCKVTDENGPIRRGDALTASSTPGHAMRAEPMMIDGKPLHRPGTLVGKALENHDQGVGVIEVFVTSR